MKSPMKAVHTRPPRCRHIWASVQIALALFATVPGVARAADPLSSTAKTQIQALLAEKESRTPAQRKMDSQLVYLAKQRRKEVIAKAAPKLVVDLRTDAADRVLVDLNATVFRQVARGHYP
jgi:hypothetical protein